ncbi:SDR family oxidoreductase [Chloroflexota bacterium]
MKKVVVTGGAGFIGSHLAKELVKRGYQILILDDLSTGKIENIEDLLKNDEVEFVQGTVTDPPLLIRLCKNASYVFHLAAVPSVPRSIENPQASHEVNINGTLNVLQAARENNANKVIFASSSSVYGDTPAFSQKEDMAPHPLSPYAVTKLAGEYYCQVFHEVYKLPTVCLRYFNVYGPRQDPNSQYAAVIPTFIKMVSEGNQPVIFGAGEQTRDFIFIKDAIAANILMAESDASGLFNIARGERVTINELAKLVISIMGSKFEAIHHEPRPGDIRHSLADISKVKAFGYEPQYTLEDGLSEIVRMLNER